MFTIYYSNQLDIFYSLLIKILESKSINTDNYEIIILQNNSMIEFIKNKLSMLKISKNIIYMLPNDFAWQLLNLILPNMGNHKNIFSKSIMIWKIISILFSIKKDLDINLINNQYQNDIEEYYFKLSFELTNLFNKYLKLRPDWLETWKTNKLVYKSHNIEKIQAIIWRHLLIKITKDYPILSLDFNLYNLIIQQIKKNKKKNTNLPKRIFIYGISTLPLKNLKLLEEYIDIHLMFINPCRYYWENNYKNNFQLCKNNLKQFSFFKQTKFLKQEIQVENPLLLSYGKYINSNMLLLMQLENIYEIDAFVEPNENSMLHILQRDILNCKNRTLTTLINTVPQNNKKILNPADHSLSFHVCQNKYQEIEILHKYLLNIIKNNKNIKLTDIIVMAPNINEYISVINIIFNSYTKKDYLSYVIYDQKITYTNPLIMFVLNFLELPFFTINDEYILSLLEVTSVSIHFNIGSIELKLLRQLLIYKDRVWILNNFVGIDQIPRIYWNSILHNNFLRFKLKYPNQFIVNLTNNILNFLEKLLYWYKILSKKHSIQSWILYLDIIINDFFTLSINEKIAIKLLKKQWEIVLRYALQAKYNQLLSIKLLKNILLSRLDKIFLNKNHTINAIYFYSLTPIRSITSKIICLIGLNKDSYPSKKQINSNLDLTIQFPRVGDYNRVDKEHYFFLELILSTQQQLYISFICHNINTTSIKSQSILINELSNYIIKSFYYHNGKHTNDKINEKKVYHHLWKKHNMYCISSNFLFNKK